MEIDYEKEIKRTVSLFFNQKTKDINKWYERPHRLLSERGYSPKELVEKGDGQRVLEWVKMVLDR